MKNNQNRFKGPFQILKLKPHNTVKIKTSLKANIFVHIKNLKPFHGSTSKKFSFHFQKQGGDANSFDYSDNKDRKFERSYIKDKRDRQQPKEQYKDDENNQTDKDSSYSKEEDCQITFQLKEILKIDMSSQSQS
jgi:hypothetical protein